MDVSRPRVDAWLPFVLRNTEFAVIALGESGRIEAWLGAAEQVFGFTAEEAVGMDVRTLFTSEDRRLALDRQEMAVAIASGRSDDDRWQVRKDGSRFWASGALHVVRRDDGSLAGFVKILRDRTDVRAQLDALHNRVVAQENRHLRRTEFMLRLGHELRNALASIQNSAAVMTMTEDADVRMRALGIVKRQQQVIATLLDDLSRTAAGDTEGVRLQARPVVVQEALEDAVSAMRPLAEDKRQELVLTVPPVPFSVQADPARLQQMLMNLLGNAIKYTPPDGHIVLSATVEAESAVIRVTDDGMGIPPDVLPGIFELFTRYDPMQQAPGLGVGLAVVKELASAHHGSVDARSAGPGKGSVFTLRLPLKGPA